MIVCIAATWQGTEPVDFRGKLGLEGQIRGWVSRRKDITAP